VTVDAFTGDDDQDTDPHPPRYRLSNPRARVPPRAIIMRTMGLKLAVSRCKWRASR
jgi:hypothetical protein